MLLNHCGRDKMADILQTTFYKHFLVRKNVVLCSILRNFVLDGADVIFNDIFLYHLEEPFDSTIF